MSPTLIYTPMLFIDGNIVEAATVGQSRTFNPTSTGYSGENADKSTGNLGNAPTFPNEPVIYY